VNQQLLKDSNQQKDENTTIELTHEERCFLNGELANKKNHIIEFLLDYSQHKNAIYNNVYKEDKDWAKRIIDGMKHDFKMAIEIQKKLFPDSGYGEREDETFLEFINNLK
jgi:hypothetical protein